MKSIFSLFPVALLFAATTGFGASTECPKPAGAVAKAAGSSATAAIPSSAVPKVTESDAGEITTEQILQRLFGHRSDAPETRSAVGGSKLLDLQGRLSMVSILVRNPDGTIGYFCVDNINAARKLLAGPARPAAVPAAVPATIE
jgi:hypothetical protein